MNEPTQRVVTESGQEYTLGVLLGIGGQGAVYAVHGQPRAVKILQTRSPYDRERLRGQITFVQGRPLDGLPLARPLEMLQAPLVGYVMELLTEMEPLDRLMRPPRDVPETGWYIETGGLRRRLRLLARCAEALAQLHGIPLVYMDLSPWNVFVSRHAESAEVWLIDTDNLQCITSPLETVFGTRPYVAPELSRGYTGANSLTDAYSFAVLAFETLAQTHPFEGELGARLDPEALQSQIDRGGLPWVFHPEDHRNPRIQGIDDPALVLTRALTEAFQKSFGPGLKDSTVRPGMAVWADLLHAAADLTVQCPGCAGSYYPRSGRCPWCDHPRPAFALANVRRWEPEAAREEERLGGKQAPFAQVAVTAGETVALTDRITRAMSGSGSHGRCLELTLRQGALEVRGVDGRQYQLTETHTGRQNRVGGGRRIPSEAPEGTVLLHFGPLDKPHRLATFKFYQEDRA